MPRVPEYRHHADSAAAGISGSTVSYCFETDDVPFGEAEPQLDVPPHLSRSAATGRKGEMERR